MKVYRYAETPQRPIDNPAALLRTTTVNLCRTWDTRQRRAVLRMVQHGPDATLLTEWERCLDASLRRLPHDQHAVVVLRYWLGLSESEIADALECRPGTVKSRHAQALRHPSKGNAMKTSENREDDDLCVHRSTCRLDHIVDAACSVGSGGFDPEASWTDRSSLEPADVARLSNDWSAVFGNGRRAPAVKRPILPRYNSQHPPIGRRLNSTNWKRQQFSQRSAVRPGGWTRCVPTHSTAEVGGLKGIGNGNTRS